MKETAIGRRRQSTPSPEAAHPDAPRGGRPMVPSVLLLFFLWLWASAVAQAQPVPPPSPPAEPDAEPVAAPPGSAPSSSRDLEGASAPAAATPAPPTPYETTVVGVRSGQYRAEATSAASRIETPLFDLPFAVQSVPAAVLEDESASSLWDAERHLGGVHLETIGGFMGANDTQFLRGFRNRFVYYDGFVTETIPSINLSTLEAVEYVKGPTSVLYGLMEPGGMLNLVPKPTLATPYRHVLARVGSYRYGQTAVDLGGPLTPNATVRYRITGGYQSNESFRDYFTDRRLWLAPRVDLQLTPSTEVTLSVSHSQQKRTLDEGVSFSAEGTPVSDIDTFLGEPGFPGQRYTHTMATVRLRQRIFEQLTFRSALLASLWSNDMRAVRRSRPAPTERETVERLFEDSDFSQSAIQWQNDLLLNLVLGPTKHALVAGVDWRTRAADLDMRRGSFPEVNIRNPQYGVPAPTDIDPFDMSQDQRWIGVFAQENLSMFDSVHLSLGGRWDSVEQVDFNERGEPQRVSQDDQAVTGRVGLLYQLPRVLLFGRQHRLAVFGNVGQSFVPTGTSSLDFEGNALDPETGLQYEAGVKLELLDARLSGTASVYRLTKDDVAISDLDHEGCMMNAGTLRSEGFEVDLAGEPYPGLQVIASYTYIHTEVVESTTLPEGNHFRNIPTHSGSVWLKYTLQQGPLRDLGLGVGLFAVGERYGDDAGSFDLEGYTCFDAGLFYQRQLAPGLKVDAQLNVKNLADKEYYLSSLAATRVFPGTPRSLEFTAGLEF